MATDTRQILQKKLQALLTSDFREGHLKLLNSLGYSSDKIIPIPKADPTQFIQMAESRSGVTANRGKAKLGDWKKADILFQLTDEELSGQTSLFKATELKTQLLQSYLFFAIELKGAHYSRTDLSNMTRQINRLFPMPVMVFFTYDDKLSIAVINRRRNKREEHKDVLGKVTLIHDINLTEPHRGHLDILESFSVEALRTKKLTIDSFDALHYAWEEIFNVELLNKRFYRELSDWYFWALEQVEFPDDLEKNRDTRNATSLIRLLTRLIFCWFIKEKGLIPENLFLPEKLNGILKSLNPEDSTFYKAILQNLFFATLNQRMGKDDKGKSFRQFATDDSFVKNRNQYGVKNLFRYADAFLNPKSALQLFEDIPFLNGGLFECLDREDDNGKVQYLDGFSRNKKKHPRAPNELFFGEPRVVELSGIYAKKKRRKQRVRGLIHILHGYKFTIVENTPIEQEIALDPELLGQVFENLLASYNPETQTTARKQTGSFYTPRPIVDYMVTESLKCYLKGELCKSLPDILEADADEGLEILFNYTEREHVFTDEERDILIQAIDNCKILDPACGSGAFPMGALHKLVFLLQKLDPHNVLWMRQQIDKATEIPDVQAREASIEAIEKAFADNELDYGRKLYLIENCLYGIDIQPIAIQITKLRCFISLVCDQRVNSNKAKNYGIRPLPNLETKFVAANTLISLPKQMNLDFSPTVRRLVKDLEDVRHHHFSATRREKLFLQRKDKDLREKLAVELRKGIFNDETIISIIVAWKPYDPTSVADFFDAEWMFGKELKKGFDIVIGNPPYMRIQGIKQNFPALAKYYKKHYLSATGSFDLYVIFMERGMQLITDEGLLNFINPDKWVNAAFGKGIRSYCMKNKNVYKLISFGAHQVFSSCTYSSLLWMRKEINKEIAFARIDPEKESHVQIDHLLSVLRQDSFTNIPLDSLSSEPWILADGKVGEVIIAIQEHKRTVDDVFVKIFQGIASSKDSVYFLRDAKNCGGYYNAYSPELDERIDIESDLVKPLLLGNQVHRYQPIETANLVVFPYKASSEFEKKPALMSRTTIASKYPLGWKYLKRCESILRERERGRFDNEEWFQFGRKQGISEGGTPKLLAPDISLGGDFSLDRTGVYYTTTTLYGYIKKPNVQESYESLLAILNSNILWFYLKISGSVLANGYFRYKPAYLKNFPIPKLGRIADFVLSNLSKLMLFVESKSNIGRTIVPFLESLIDACVMECYFQEHMAERDLLFHDALTLHLDGYNPDAPDPEQQQFTQHLYRTLNAPDSVIRNRLLRLTADSPNLLAVIKNAGR